MLHRELQCSAVRKLRQLIGAMRFVSVTMVKSTVVVQCRIEGKGGSHRRFEAKLRGRGLVLSEAFPSLQISYQATLINLATFPSPFFKTTTLVTEYTLQQCLERQEKLRSTGRMPSSTTIC